MAIQLSGDLQFQSRAGIAYDLGRAILQQPVSIIPVFIRFSRNRLYVLRRRAGSETQQKGNHQPCDTFHFYGSFLRFWKSLSLLSRKVKEPHSFTLSVPPPTPHPSAVMPAASATPPPRHTSPS